MDTQPMNLDQYVAASATDSNLWWRLGSGHHLNLLDEALDRIAEQQAEIERLREALEKLLDAAGKANAWLFQGSQWDVDGRARVACALNGVLCEIYAANAAGGDDE